MTNTLSDNIMRVRERVAEAALSAGRTPSSIKLIAVTKTVEPERIRQALELGIDRIGENRVQELLEKFEAYCMAEKHLIGQLQSNKVRKIVGKVDMIHSVDRLSLAREIDRCAQAAEIICPVLIQVNLGQEAQKGGVSPEELIDFAGEMFELNSLRPDGLMTIPPVCAPDEARRYFARLRQLLCDCNAALSGHMTELSMGMSGDYCEGIREGATFVRVGSALFGKRM